MSEKLRKTTTQLQRAARCKPGTKPLVLPASLSPVSPLLHVVTFISQPRLLTAFFASQHAELMEGVEKMAPHAMIEGPLLICWIWALARWVGGEGFRGRVRVPVRPRTWFQLVIVPTKGSELATVDLVCEDFHVAAFSIQPATIPRIVCTCMLQCWRGDAPFTSRSALKSSRTVSSGTFDY